MGSKKEEEHWGKPSFRGRAEKKPEPAELEKESSLESRKPGENGKGRSLRRKRVMSCVKFIVELWSLLFQL